ncbi:MAG: glycosyltransferase family 39 protein [Candidatus Sumerlaeia bacterium]|nr:glycosyltransferase family 39 protein [Candidatus Sumerlaeia bacterium]
MQTDELNTKQSMAEPTPWSAIFWIVILGTLIFAVRFLSPEDLMDNDQQRPAAYALDAVVNENWVVQRDDTGDVMSKPPFSTWLVAGSILAFGGLSRFSLYFPVFASSLIIGVLILVFGSRYLGRTIGWWSALLYLFSPAFDTMIMLNRSDSVFAVLVFGGALALYESVLRRKSAIPFWLLMAAATLTKGPLGLLLGIAGVLPLLWKNGETRRNLLMPSQGVGLMLYLLLCAGWFAAAYGVLGQALVDKMIGKELVGHAVGKGIPLAEFYQPIVYLLLLLLPWSLGIVALFWKRPAEPEEPESAAMFRLFLAGTVVVSLVIFGIATHHRTVHLFPVVPFFALMCGGIWVRLLGLAKGFSIGTPKHLAVVVLGIALVLGQNGVRIFTASDNKAVVETQQLREIAAELSAKGFPKENAIHHHTTPYGLQAFWGTMQLRLSAEEAAALLEGSEPCFILTRHPSQIRALLADSNNARELARWELAHHKGLHLISNQESFP